MKRMHTQHVNIAVKRAMKKATGRKRKHEEELQSSSSLSANTDHEDPNGAIQTKVAKKRKKKGKNEHMCVYV